MSRLLYVASDSELKERPNPYVLCLSINEAIEKGIEIDLELLEDVDRDAPGTILWAESEEMFDYPDIISMEGYDDPVGTNKRYRMEIAGRISENNIECILNYIKEYVVDGSELEFWKIWLGEEEELNTAKKTKYALSDINSEILLRFIESDEYPECMIIHK